MRLVRTLFLRVRGLFGTHRQERELSAEMESHLALHMEDNLRAGKSQEEARREALMKLGGVEQTKEMYRERRGLPILETLFQDLRFGMRVLGKSRGFTVVAVLTLALGIGANAVIFSVVHAVLLQPLAMQDPSHVVLVQEHWQGLPGSVSVGNFVDLQKQSGSFSELSSSLNASFNLMVGETPERVQGELATADYFPTFGVQPVAGRVFTAEEDRPGHDKVVLISERLWRARFHAESTILGQTLWIDSAPATVIGVMPKTFDPLLLNSDIWVPAAFTPAQLAEHDEHFLNVMGRLRPGVSLAQAQSEAHVIALRLEQQYPIDDKGRDLRLTPLATILLGDQQLSLRLMMAAVGFLLLIACANIANLQLARSRARQKEIALRAALGASPNRIVRQLLVENILLGFAGGAVGVLLAFWGVSWIIAHGPADVPRLQESRIDSVTMAFACVVALLSSFVFGLAPALRSAFAKLSEVFKESAGTFSAGRDRVRSFLVAGELALALVLMAGAGLLIRSALIVSHLDPGFDTSNLIVGRVGLPDVEYHDPAVARRTFGRLVNAAEALPGVKSAALVSRAPLASGGSSNGLLAEGKPFDPANLINSILQIVSPGYLSTVRIPLKAGRGFTDQDTRDKTLVTLVNETLARTMWPGENPIGKRFACCEPGPKGRMDPVWHEVVGVVGDVRSVALDEPVQPEFYLPMAQMPSQAWDWTGRTMDLAVRTNGGPAPIREIQSTVASIAPGVPIYQLSTMQRTISGTLAQSQFNTFLLAIFAVAALLLASVGIYGVLSYTVAQRTRDIGIRMALGATQAQVVGGVLHYGVRLTCVGLAIGLAGAVAGTRVLSTLLYGVQATDAATFAAVSLVLAAVALTASYLPARRAARVDPLVALRHE
jgi:putative ABC transport system permease protein